MITFKKSLIPFVIIGSALGGFATAEEKNGIYLTIGGGTNIILDTDWDETLSGVKYTGEVELDSKFSIDGGIGYDFGQWRTELTYQSFPTDLKSLSAEKVVGSVGVNTTASGDVDIKSYFLTAYYDLPVYQISNTKITPYIGAGIGSTNIDVGTITVDSVSTGGGDDSATAYQLKFGSSFEMSKQSDLFIEGIYFSSGEFDILGTNFDPVKSLGVKSGIRFRF